MTPLSDRFFAFRPEHPSYSHKLIVFAFDKLVPSSVQELSFPTDLPWADWRMGTGMPPIWIDERRALFVVHGISIEAGRYVYRIGISLLEKEGELFKLTVYPHPIITPDTFVAMGSSGTVEELRPAERRVVYICGGVVQRNDPDILHLYVNVGDKATFDVHVGISDLLRLFDQESSPIPSTIFEHPLQTVAQA